MRGAACKVHPPSVLGKKKSCCGRTDSAVEVEDHEVGFMFVGTSDIEQAKRLVDEYADNPEGYVFAHRLWYQGRACAVWLSDAPTAEWYGANADVGEAV